MNESQLTPHPLDDFSPDVAARAESGEGSSLLEMARRFFYKFPDLCILAAVVLVNLLVLGPVTGYGWEPSRIFNWRWLLARPFSQAWGNIDAVVLGFTSAQVVLLTLWACYSQRLILTRMAGWAVAVSTLMVILLARMNPDYSTLELLLMFGWLCLGTVLTSLYCRLGGLKVELDLPGIGKSANRQFAIRELMLLSLLVGGLCAVVAVLASLSYSFWWWTFLVRESRREYFWVAGVRIAFIGCCSGLAFPFFAKIPSGFFAGLARLAIGVGLSLALCAGLVWIVEYARETIYLEPIPPSYGTMGQYFWLASHFGLLAGTVWLARSLGLRAVPTSHQHPVSDVAKTPTSEARNRRLLRSAARIGIFAVVLAPILLGLWRGADYYSTYRLNNAVSAFGTLAEEPRNNGKWSVYLEKPVDASALAVLNDSPGITDLYIMSRDQASAKSLAMLKKLKHVKRITGFNNSLTPNEVAELASALPGVSISL